MRPSTRFTVRCGFTLVELLVVVGIITLLIALFLPALTAARDSANRAKCLANLRSMAQAAHMHALEHKGFMPVAGAQSPTHLGVFATPEGLNDRARRKYVYLVYPGGEVRPLLLPVALGHYMGLAPVLLGNETNDRVLAMDAVRSRFACPAQDSQSVRKSYVLGEDGGTIGPPVHMSYLFNGAALARRVAPWGETPAGNLNRIRRPSDVFLFADGRGAYGGSGWQGYGVHAEYGTGETLYYYYSRLGGRESGQFDPYRHRNRMNVVFVDGHGETLMLPRPSDGSAYMGDPRGTLDRVGVTWGIFN